MSEGVARDMTREELLAVITHQHEYVASLEAELRTLQGENEAMRIDQEVTHNEAFAYQQQIGRLRTALDDARGALEEALDWIPDSLPGVRGRLLAILDRIAKREEEG